MDIPSRRIHPVRNNPPDRSIDDNRAVLFQVREMEYRARRACDCFGFVDGPIVCGHPCALLARDDGPRVCRARPLSAVSMVRDSLDGDSARPSGIRCG